MPVAVALLVPCLAYIGLDDGFTLSVALERMTSSLNSFPLLAVPLFVLAGTLANSASVTDRLYGFAQDLIGHFRGGLGYVNVAASLGFSWMSGAAVSDTAALGSIQVPAMQKHGYSDSFSTGLTASSSLITPIMPPSIPAIIYGVSSGVSIGALFVAGVIPALVISALLCVAVFVYARNRPELRSNKAAVQVMLRSAVRAIPVLFAPVIILGGILSGFFTPTEAAAIAVAYIGFLGLIAYRSVGLRKLYRVLLSTAETTGTIMLIVASASVFGYVLTRERAPDNIAEAVVGATDSPIVFLLFVSFALLVLGTVIEPISAILIVTPVLLPAAASFGIDPIQFGSIVIFSLMIGLITPPVGIVLYVLESVTSVCMPEIIKGVLPFVALMCMVTLLMIFIPWLTLGLPSLLGF